MRLVCLCCLTVLSSLFAACDADRPSKQAGLTGPAVTFNRLIDERGPLTYLSRTYSAAGVADRSFEVTGMVVMRHEADLRPIGGRYYDDGFGNLMSFGDFSAPTLGGRSRYAVTFRKNGGMQLALDFRDDDIVDAVFDLDRDGRLGALADPDNQWLLDCLSQEIVGGANLVEAANTCLGKAGGGGGGGLGPAAAHDVDRLAKPDCAKRGGGLPASIAQPGADHESTVVMETDDHYKVVATNTENSDGSSDYEIKMYDPEGTLVYQETGHKDADDHMVRQTIRTFDHGDGETVIRERTYREGKLLSDTRTSLTIEIGDAIIEYQEQQLHERPRRNPFFQPPTGPECQDCPVEDPRCREAPNDIVSLWDCQAETDLSLLDCLKRMQDEIYTATGGRCSTQPGDDDRPTIRCSERELEECLKAGRSIAECIRKNPGYGGGDNVNPGPGEDDFLRDRFGQSRGRVGFFIDTTPMGGVFIALCAHGLEEFCRGGGRF